MRQVKHVTVRKRLHLIKQKRQEQTPWCLVIKGCYLSLFWLNISLCQLLWAPLRFFWKQHIKIFMRQVRKNRSWHTVLSCQAFSLADIMPELNWWFMNRLWYENSSGLDSNLNNCSVMRQTYLDGSWWRLNKPKEGSSVKQSDLSPGLSEETEFCGFDKCKYKLTFHL